MRRIRNKIVRATDLKFGGGGRQERQMDVLQRLKRASARYWGSGLSSGNGLAPGCGVPVDRRARRIVVGLSARP
jgi:hypothetical protein